MRMKVGYPHNLRERSGYFPSRSDCRRHDDGHKIYRKEDMVEEDVFESEPVDYCLGKAQSWSITL